MDKKNWISTLLLSDTTHISLSFFQSESNMNGEKSMNIIASSNLHKPQIKEILGAAIISYSFQASGLDSCAFKKKFSNFALIWKFYYQDGNICIDNKQ